MMIYNPRVRLQFSGDSNLIFIILSGNEGY